MYTYTFISLQLIITESPTPRPWDVPELELLNPQLLLLPKKLCLLLNVVAESLGSGTRVGAPRRRQIAPETSVDARALKISGLEAPRNAARTRSMQSQATRTGGRRCLVMNRET